MRPPARKTLPAGLAAAVALILLLPAGAQATQRARRREGAARAGAARGRARRAARGGRDPASRRDDDGPARRALRRAPARPAARDRPHAARAASRRRSAARSRCSSSSRGGSACDDTVGARLPGLPVRLGRRHGAPAAAAHERGAGLHALEGLRRPADQGTARGRRRRRSSTGCAATTSCPSGARRGYEALDDFIRPARGTTRAGRPAGQVGLIAEQVTARRAMAICSRSASSRLARRMSRTSFPTRRISLPRPFIRGYARASRRRSPRTSRRS